MRMLPDRESQNRALSLGVLLLVPLVSFAIWYAVTTPPEHDDEFPGILQRYGYSAMALPSRLFGPGTIMTVETLRSGALHLHLACRIDDPGLEAKIPGNEPEFCSRSEEGIQIVGSRQALDRIRSRWRAGQCNRPVPPGH